MKKKITLKERVNKARHPYEITFNIISYVLSIIVYVGLGYALIVASNTDTILNKLANFTGLRSKVFELIIRIGGPTVFIILALLLGKLLFVNMTFVGESSSSNPRLSQTKFKEVNDIYNKLVKELGLNRVPEVYVCSKDVDPEYLGLTICSEMAISIHSKLIQNAYKHNDFSIVEYTLARKLARIYLGHYNPINLVMTFPIKAIPYYRDAWERIECYSADRFAADMVGVENAVRIIYEDSFDTDLFDENKDIMKIVKELIKSEHKYEKDGRWFYNLESNEPLPVYRLSALIEDKPGRVF